MISSLRRITLTIFFITLIAFGIGIFSTDFSLCNDVVKCVANVSLYNVDITTAQSTPQSLPNKNFDWKLFNEAMRVALAEDDKVLVEVGIVGREIEVAILEGRDGGRPRASLPGEIVLTTREFYDFEGKYLGGDGAEVVCPATLTEDETERIREVGRRAFEAVDGRDLARVDVFLTADGEVVINELNTMPGFTPISMFPACWLASGVSYPELIDELITLGVQTPR